jgi:hypothetical protein
MNYLRVLNILFFITILNLRVLATDSTSTHQNKVSQLESYSPFTEMPAYNALLTYIQMYDIFKDKVIPRPPRVIEDNETLDFPGMNPLFMPLVFDYNKKDYRIIGNNDLPVNSLLKSEAVDSFIKMINEESYTRKITNDIMHKSETKYIGFIKYDQRTLPKPEKLIFQINGKKPETLVRQIPTFPVKQANTRNFPRAEYNPWSTGGYAKLQFSQTYISPNWSKGGESNMAGLASLYLEANYNNLKNIQFTNNFEIKVGLNTVTSDSLRNFNISTDQVRLASNLGIKMYNNWYYSLSSEFLTQILDNYQKNTMTLRSSLLSPAKLFISLGMDFKKSDKKVGYDLSVTLSPLTYKLNYLYDNVNLSPSSYGIVDGKHFGHELGTRISSNSNWKLTEKINWKSKFYYFTNFAYQDSEWENTLDLDINNYLSTQIFLHLKLDDRIERNPGDPLLQMQELLSFGFVYRI